MKEEFLLYHYTSEAGFKGILSSQCLWATHYSHLNDEEEISDILRHIDVFEKNSLSSKAKYFCDFVRDVVTTYYLSADNKADFYVTCFSDDADSRNLWTEWNCRYAICFCPKKLNQLIAAENEFAIGTEYIRQVIYKAKDKQRILQAWKNEFDHVVVKGNMGDNKARDSIALRGVCLPALYKNPFRWSVQREYRIIVRYPTGVSKDIRPEFWTKKPKHVHSQAGIRRIHLFNCEGRKDFTGLSQAIRGVVVGPEGDINLAREIMNINGLDVPIHISNLVSA